MGLGFVKLWDIVMDVAFGEEMAEFVLGFHVGEELVEDDLIVVVFGCLCPDEIGDVSRELLFGAIC